MRIMRSILGKKLIALGLLSSLMCLLFFPVLQANQYNTSNTYADWLRSQLGGITSEAVEFALEAALASDAENLDGFIGAFVDAYTEASLELEPAPIDNVALFALLKHQSLLLDDAITPHLLLKSALVRTLSSQNRAGSIFGGAFERATAVKFGQQFSAFVTLISPLFSVGRTHTISPRAP